LLFFEAVVLKNTSGECLSANQTQKVITFYFFSKEILYMGIIVLCNEIDMVVYDRSF